MTEISNGLLIVKSSKLLLIVLSQESEVKISQCRQRRKLSKHIIQLTLKLVVNNVSTSKTIKR